MLDNPINRTTRFQQKRRKEIKSYSTIRLLQNINKSTSNHTSSSSSGCSAGAQQNTNNGIQ